MLTENSIRNETVVLGIVFINTLHLYSLILPLHNYLNVIYKYQRELLWVTSKGIVRVTSKGIVMGYIKGNC